MIAYQKIVRDSNIDNSLFPRPKNVDIKTAVIKEISRAEAKMIIEHYEWLGCLAAVNWFYYGIFFDGCLGGAVVYGQEYIENLGKWDKYGYTGKIILLSRGACVSWAHPHSASKLIRQSMKMLPERFKVVTCTVDDLAGEIGTIYQACGFTYIGSMRDANPNVKSRKGDRSGFLINGKLYGSRSMRQKHGTTNMEVLSKVYPNIQKVKQNSKGRYFGFLGTAKEKEKNLKAIEHLIKPYPKRTQNDVVEVSPFHLINIKKEKQINLFM